MKKSKFTDEQIALAPKSDRPAFTVGISPCKCMLLPVHLVPRAIYFTRDIDADGVCSRRQFSDKETAIVVQHFEFSARLECVCGTMLADEDTGIKKYFPQGQVLFRRCANCGSYIQSPQLTAKSLSAWYDSPEYRGSQCTRGIGYLDYERDEHQRRVEARRRYQRDLAPHLPPSAALLEIGAASGALLAEIREQGNSPFGCDLSPNFAKLAARNYGLNVVVCDWLDMDIPDESLDAVVLLGTISNLSRLVDSMKKVRRKLRSTGFVFFNFPAADGFPARIYGARMWMFTPSVMQFMTQKGILLALERAGLRIDWQGTDRQSPTLAKLIGHARLGWLYSAIARVGLSQASLPFSVPLPGIVSIRARPREMTAPMSAP